MFMDLQPGKLYAVRKSGILKAKNQEILCSIADLASLASSACLRPSVLSYRSLLMF